MLFGVGGLLLNMGVAAAAPIPDLGALQPVNPDQFATYSTYGAGGWQFVTPNGVRCRIMTMTRWGSPPEATCWGADLPGTGAGSDVNYGSAKGAYGSDAPQAVLGHADLEKFETYRSYEHRSTVEVDRVDPASYNLLAAGSKITLDGTRATVTCGAPTDDSVACILNNTGEQTPSTGFVLSPQGSRSF
ncbi:hypothetical protein KIH27_06935 [Mycobacterium sp. M1]|uniref:Secreted protein n=1 Tax=Mycolicibacter acidiphilus TaxID=2835306 RepID=A0ABS5RGM6_9MYCO|nr:hypothetical protein [Mycolicibacter acidiphilus]MBS9533324.1 hypothetical protein [Mycolicibacter acidiphilus]